MAEGKSRGIRGLGRGELEEKGRGKCGKGGRKGKDGVGER